MRIVIIGAGDQARIVREILSYDRSIEVVAFVDNSVHGSDENIRDIPVEGDLSVLPGLLKNDVTGAIIAIGDNGVRADYYKKLKSMGLKMVNAVHPTASSTPSVRMGEGITVAIGAIISTGAKIGDNVIVNTGAIIDHDGEIGDHAHIGPGCSLAGRVTIKKGAFIGIGSVVREYITIGENAIIGAGSVVLEDVPDNVVAVGAPAKVIKQR